MRKHAALHLARIEDAREQLQQADRQLRAAIANADNGGHAWREWTRAIAPAAALVKARRQALAALQLPSITQAPPPAWTPGPAPMQQAGAEMRSVNWH